MRGRLMSGVASSALVALLGGVAGGALAADLAVKAPPVKAVAPAWSWAGFYMGVHGAAYAGSSHFDDPFGSSIFGDRVSTPAFGFGAQMGYNWQSGKWVYGLEADGTWLAGGGGTNTCGAFDPNYIPSNCGAHPSAVGTVTARVGMALGPEGHTLAYVKGGFAWQDTTLTATNNSQFGLFAPQMNSAAPVQAGWTIGAGVEQALTPAWSVKFEYDYMNFGHSGNVTLPSSMVGFPFNTPNGGIAAFFLDPANSKVSSDAHVFKLGLNYKLGEDPSSSFGHAAPLYAKAPAHAWAPGWEFEGGGRYWYSWGKFQKDFPGDTFNDKTLVSRLTYKDTANTGEFFGRIDTPYNVFIKGFVGGGGIASGHLNDEDFGLFDVINNNTIIPISDYSNTLSKVGGSLFYGTIDVGYDFLRDYWYKVGAFAGYNRYKYTLNANGCTQISDQLSGICAPAFPTSTLVITESDTWDSLRIGISAETQLFDRWKISGDVAYIPYTKFTGTDNHWLRDLVIPESGHGQGVQAEAFLNYAVTDHFNLGVGGRYWALWTSLGSDTFIQSGVSQGVTPRNDTFRAERAGVTFQGSYKF